MKSAVEQRFNRLMLRLSWALLACSALFAWGCVIRACHDGHMIPVHAAAVAIEQAVDSIATEVHFSPAENLEAIDLAQLDQAKKSIDIATFANDDAPIADELVKLAKRGVTIRIYRDALQYQGELAHGQKGGVDLNDLFKGQPNIQLRVKGVTALQHLKAYEVDGAVLREGSANWSAQGEKVQDNSLVLIRDPAAVARFEADFEAMWNRPTNVTVQ
jgi:phosphatidylserine/phosphatidylglycerophosphate/cardiolipin synthase-like enzyme